MKHFFTAIVGTFLWTAPLLTRAQIQHVEPLNWWVGMKDQQLQLLIHGQDVGTTLPTLSYPGVKLLKVHRAQSPNYLFLDLAISKNARPGTFNLVFSRQGRTVYSQPYTLKQRRQSASAFRGFSAEDVIYLLNPDRFANGDTTNDVVPGTLETTLNRSAEGGRHGGDLRGIINHLDYIADMGFTAIWPTPVLENNMPAYSYHGYAITNHYKVDPRYGSIDDYIELAEKAKQCGIKLIFDEVLNHTGSGYWWMKDLPFKNWLNKADSMVLTTHRRTTNQDLYASKFDKDLMINGWFDNSMPDMNGANPFMANYLIQNTIWWIETLQLGGIRQDTYGYSDKAFLKNWSCRIMSEYPNFSMVGEEWTYNPLIAAYWQRGKINHDGYQSCLTSTMDFPLQAALVQALKDPEEKWSANGWTKLYEALANDFVYANPNNMLVFGDNHDMDRLFTQLNQDEALTKMAITYLLTIRGIPQVYYGTEVLAQNTQRPNNHGAIRSDFPGGWPGDASNAFTGVGLAEPQQRMQAYTKTLLNWRKTHQVIANGKTLHFAPFDGLYVYFRYNAKDTVMVVMNKLNTSQNIAPSRFAEILANKTSATDVLTGKKQPIGSLSVAPLSATVFVIQ
ncbi:MAG: alpha-amlyase [Bacteroidetes bacterium]|nr:MAG: alpha-amlyase [Bacteroidota bacterium]